MIPWPVTIIPSFVLIKSIPLIGGNDILGAGGTGLLNTLWSIILPGIVNVIGIFFLRQYFLNLPAELEDAARVDGCNEFGVLWHIILPISVAGMATFALLSFETSWNSFIWPLIMLSRQAVFTLPIGLRAFYDAGAAGDNFIDYGPLMAASVLFILPVLLLFLAMQRVFVQGIALSGIKG
jgi:multiple sugar transport system permease protein